MADLKTGERDALTRNTTPMTGAYYFVPSLELRSHADVEL